MKSYFFTSESVTEGHPDKMCDQIADGILDAVMEEDPNGRVACEVCITTGLVMILGEITAQVNVDIPKITRNIIGDIGYNKSEMGFDASTCGIICSIDEQSADIALGVDNSYETKMNSEVKIKDVLGAGDQGMMFGYATNETKVYMPYPIYLANKLSYQLMQVRKKGILPYLFPDGKTQVTVEYENGRPKRIDTVVLSTQHSSIVDLKTLKIDIKKHVFDEVLAGEPCDDNTKFYINPTGRFVIGGPHGDSGVTGRKIMVDSYGGWARHGGGAFSGKDYTKVDRSAAYAARYIAKNIVAAGLADRCEIQLSYAIGIASPLSISVNTFGTNKVEEEVIVKAVEDNFDLTPNGIINMLNLKRPIYRKTASYGHFGRDDIEFPWERLNKISLLTKYL